MMIYKVYYIGGASGSGKTAIKKTLTNEVGHKMSIFDFDDIGVPENADKTWRQKTTEAWLQRVLKEERDVCLLGQTVLGEILACPSVKQFNKIHYLLLDVSDRERDRRLRLRDPYGATKDMLNWSAWLRRHHQDPQWAQHVVKEGAWEELSFDVWDHLHDWKTLAAVDILDTTSLDIKAVTRDVANWIRQGASDKFND